MILRANQVKWNPKGLLAWLPIWYIISQTYTIYSYNVGCLGNRWHVQSNWYFAHICCSERNNHLSAVRFIILGLSSSGKTLYHRIPLSLKATKLGVEIFVTLWNLTDASQHCCRNGSQILSDDLTISNIYLSPWRSRAIWPRLSFHAWLLLR